MAEKHTTLAQLRLNALRTKSEVLALLVDALEGVQVGMTVTLPAANWVSNTQAIQNASLLADDNYYYIVCPDAASYAAGCSAGLKADNVTTDGQITFHCDSTPTSDLTVHILRLEVEV